MEELQRQRDWEYLTEGWGEWRENKDDYFEVSVSENLHTSHVKL